MRTIIFHKYQGTGNDFVMIDDRMQEFDLKDHAFIARLCHRKFGIGADGLIVIRNHVEADFEMIYYNADGYLTSLCGNGSRCAVKFAHQLGVVGESCRFMTVEGILNAKIEESLAHIKMPDVKEVEVSSGHFFLDTGSPHHICYVNEVEKYDVFHEGRKIRRGAPYFEKGTNVNFVQSLGDSHIFVRTYERGVEDETLSCGTGAAAAAIVEGLRGAQSPVDVKTPGGDLRISFEKNPDGSFTDIFLIGPAEKVFSGEFVITS